MRPPSSIRHFALNLLFIGAISSSLSAATLVYYNGATSGTSVTNLGTLGATGNGTITTAGAGTVTSVSTGGPGGAGDAYLSLSSGTSAGGWVNVPAASLPNFRNTSWSVSGFFNRPASSNGTDVIVHFDSGDTFGDENELYLYGQGGNTVTKLEHYPVTGFPNIQSSLALNAWHSYAITFTASGLNNGAGTLTLYLNGALIGSSSSLNLSTGGGGTGTDPLAQTLQLGGIGYVASTGSADRAFTGGLDEFAFYDFVLNSTEVAGLHNRTINPLQVVPEPSRALLFIVAILGLALRRRR